MKRRQKRYDTAQSIETEIDNANESKRNNLIEIVALDKKIDSLLAKLAKETDRYKAQQMKFQLNFIREMRDKVDARRPLLEQKLHRLKLTHAAFRTVPMQFVEDPSVVLQK